MQYLLTLILLCLISFPQSILAKDFMTLTSSKVKLYEKDTAGAHEMEVKGIDSLFGKSFEILGQSETFYKLGISSTQTAFINKKDPYLKNLPGSNYIIAKRLKDSKVTQKALIVNKPGLDNLFSSDIQYFENPMVQGPHKGKIPIFEIRYIYDETDGAILVGQSDRMKKENSDSVLVGWIDKKYIIKWNNLIGVEFDKTNFQERKRTCELGKIFPSEKELFKAQSEPVFRESNTSFELPYYANRFPVLAKKKGQNGNYYQLAYIGNAFGKRGNIVDRKDIEDAKYKLMQILNNQNVHIAILIDATKGMEYHIENVKKSVQEFLKYMSESGRMSAQVAIAVYRDYPDEERIFEIKSDFTKKTDVLIQAIDTIDVYSNTNDRGMGTYPEALFYGINETIDRLSWHDTSKGGNYILLLGDHGNHKTYEQYPQDRKFSAPMIGARLKEKIITLFALQVNISEDKRMYNRMFEAQVLDIKQNNHGRGGLKKVQANSAEKIFRGLQEIVHDFSVIKQALVGVRDSNTQIGGVYKGVFTQKLLDRYNIDPKVFDAVQICDVGFVNMINSCGANQFFEKVLITRKELESLKVQMQELSDAVMFYNPESEDIFKRTIFLVVKALTGDDLAPNENIAQFIEKKSGIPVNTQILNVTMDQLLDKVRSKKFRKKMRKYLEERVMLLDSVIKEKKIDDEVWDKTDQRFIYNISGEHIPYFFSLEQPLPDREKGLVSDSKKNHAWVPMEYLP